MRLSESFSILSNFPSSLSFSKANPAALVRPGSDDGTFYLPGVSNNTNISFSITNYNEPGNGFLMSTRGQRGGTWRIYSPMGFRNSGIRSKLGAIFACVFDGHCRHTLHYHSLWSAASHNNLYSHVQDYTTIQDPKQRLDIPDEERLHPVQRIQKSVCMHYLAFIFTHHSTLEMKRR